MKEAEKLGLDVDDEDRDVFSLMGDTDPLHSHGPKTRPTFGALDRTTKNGRIGVAGLLRDAGVMVRLTMKMARAVRPSPSFKS